MRYKVLAFMSKTIFSLGHQNKWLVIFTSKQSNSDSNKKEEQEAVASFNHITI